MSVAISSRISVLVCPDHLNANTCHQGQRERCPYFIRSQRIDLPQEVRFRSRFESFCPCADIEALQLPHFHDSWMPFKRRSKNPRHIVITRTPLDFLKKEWLSLPRGTSLAHSSGTSCVSP